MKPTRKFELGAEPKKVAILSVLVAVAGYLVYQNLLSEPAGDVETPRPAAAKPVRQAMDNIAKAAEGIPHHEFSILLSHTPEIYRQAAHADFNVLLSGHTHGGQICLPGGIPITLNCVLPRSMGNGRFNHHGMIGYTSAGAGVSIVAARFNDMIVDSLIRGVRRKQRSLPKKWSSLRSHIKISGCWPRKSFIAVVPHFGAPTMKKSGLFKVSIALPDLPKCRS